MKDHKKYHFNLSDPDSWASMPRPYLSESFIAETNRIGGFNKHGKPRFKWSWGMSEEVYVDMGEDAKAFPSGWYLKYQLCTTPTKLIGYRYRNFAGKDVVVANESDVPDGVLCVPQYSRPEQIGTPHWVLEEWREKGDADGVYDRAGYYFCRWIVADELPENPQTFLKPYREPNHKDLEILAHYVQLSAKLTSKDIKQGVAADREKEANDSAKLKANTQEEFAEHMAEILRDIPSQNLPKPSKGVIQRAWKQLEAREKQV